VKLSSELQLLRSGRRTFARFLDNTSSTWQRLAHYLMGRWRLPAGCEPEDVVQELLVGVHEYVPRWDPERGTTIDRYVVWNAANRAKRWMHNQRSARHSGRISPDCKPSVCPVPASWVEGLEGTTPEERLDIKAAKRFAARPAINTHAAAELRLLLSSALAQTMPSRHRLALAALSVESDVDLAAKTLYDNPDARRYCRLGNEDHARALVRQSVRRFAAGAA